MKQQFDTLDVLALEVEVPPTGLVNLVKNPSGELGGWYWVTPTTGASITGTTDTISDVDGQKLVYTTASGANYFTTENLPVTVGEYVAASWEVPYLQDYYRAKIEFLASDGSTVVGSSTQTGYLQASADVQNIGVTTVPASSVYARLRFDVYSNTSGANPVGARLVTLRSVTVATSDTSGDLGTHRINLITNPSFETNTTGWIGGNATTSRSSVVSAPQGTWAMSMTCWYSGTTASVRSSTGYYPAVTGGHRYSLSFSTKAATVGRTIFFGVYWYDSTGKQIYWSGTRYGDNTTTGWTDLAGTWTAPSTATSAQVHIWLEGTVNEQHYFDGFVFEEGPGGGGYFDGDTADAGGFTYSWTGTAHASTTSAVSSNLSYIEPYTWRNILSDSNEIKVSRHEMDPGTLQATILDPELDPAISEQIRPGRRVRLRLQPPGLQDVVVTTTPETYTTTTLTNLCPNSSFETNTTSWAAMALCSISRSNTVGGSSGSWALRMSVSSAGTAQVRTSTGTSGMPVSASTQYYFSVNMRTSTSTLLSRQGYLNVSWYTSAGTLISTTSNLGGSYISNQGWNTVNYPFTSPSNAAYVSLIVSVANSQSGDLHYLDSVVAVAASTLPSYFDGDSTNDALNTYAWTGTAHGSTSTRAMKTLASPAVTDTAQAAYDPESLFEGVITSGQVTYVPDTRITITAVDHIKTLANAPGSYGVASIDEIPYIVEGAGVPWVVNGSSAQVPSATKTASSENASLLDQITLTRDTNSGYAWVDRSNVLRAYDGGMVPGGTLISDDFSEIDPSVWAQYDSSNPVVSNGDSAVLDPTSTGNTPGFYTQGYVNLSDTVIEIRGVTITGVPTGGNWDLGFAFYLDNAGSGTGWVEVGYNWQDPDPNPLRWYISARNARNDREFFVEFDIPDADDWIRISVGSRTGYSIITVDSSADEGETWTNRTTQLTTNTLQQATFDIYAFDYQVTPTLQVTVDDLLVEAPGLRELDESAYSDVVVDFNTDECINAVKVKYQRYTAGTDSTEEVVYGPYIDSASIADWGYHLAEVTYTGTENAATIQAFAESVLAANSQPQQLVREMTIPIRTEADLQSGLPIVDLYDNVIATYTPLGSAFCRVQGVEHEITPSRWSMRLDFGADGFIARPYAVPSPGTGA